jgi:hypothetical protein
MSKDQTESEEITIYLAGGIKKGHEVNKGYFWSETEITTLQENLKPYKVSFLNPAQRQDNLSDQFSVFGRDMLQVFSASVVFVDAREKRGIGVGAEMMWAKYHKIPVVTYAPKDTYYHLSTTTILDVEVHNWVHPFVESLSDCIVETIADGAEWIKKMLFENSQEMKGLEYVEGAMHHYIETQLQLDAPMKEMISSSKALQAKLERLQSGLLT